MLCAAGVLLSVSAAEAAVSMNWVTVGDAGNAADTSSYGAVGYDYRISAYEVTISQYAEFLNAKASTDDYELYNTQMGSDGDISGITRSGSSGSYAYSVVAGSGNKPITYVSWFDAARFSNWMANGQGSGSTETGVYTLNGATSGVGFTATANAAYRLPTEDEWYKAAYYDPTKDGSGGYWLHAMQSDTLTNNETEANYNDGSYTNASGNRLTDVGAYSEQASYYGTFDQGGNVWEWNDAVISGSDRGVRGGSWAYNETTLRSSLRAGPFSPTDEINFLGFRLASATVPEPSTSVLLFLTGLGLLIARRR